MITAMILLIADVKHSTFHQLSTKNAFNIFQDGWGEGLRQKGLTPTSFFPVTSLKVEISSQNILIFSSNPSATLLQNFKVIPVISPKLLDLNQNHFSRKLLFQVKSLWNWIYDNFAHRISRITKLWSHKHFYNTIWVKQ